MQRIAVIMAGGSGERFWPLSRAGRPKQLLNLTHPSLSMLEEAVERISPLVGKDAVYLSTSEPLRDALTKARLVAPAKVFAEPDKRNTLGALVWVAASLMALMPEHWMDLSVAVLTADHKIGNADDFRKSVATALELAEETGGLVTIGIEPTRAETGYGYIEVLVEEPYYSQGHRVASFREKPDLATAMDMLAAGRFLWNSGMFFWKLRSFVEALEKADSPAAEALTQISHALIAKDQAEAMRIFQTLPNLSIDYALMEKADNVWVVKASFPWDDVGEWSALERAREPDEDGNIFAGEIISLDTQGSIVLNEAEGVTTCVLGMNDVVVVATGDAILVCPKSKAQEVKRIVQELKARGSKKI